MALANVNASHGVGVAYLNKVEAGSEVPSLAWLKDYLRGLGTLPPPVGRTTASLLPSEWNLAVALWIAAQ